MLTSCPVASLYRRNDVIITDDFVAKQNNA